MRIYNLRKEWITTEDAMQYGRGKKNKTDSKQLKIRLSNKKSKDNQKNTKRSKELT